jgi:hypothetical protein
VIVRDKIARTDVRVWADPPERIPYVVAFAVFKGQIPKTGKAVVEAVAHALSFYYNDRPVTKAEIAPLCEQVKDELLKIVADPPKGTAEEIVS